MRAKILRQDLKDLKLEGVLYAKAADNNMTLSQLLENMSPTQPGENLDAFERLLKRQGINVKGNAEAGIPPATGALFLTSDDNVVLFPEFINRAARIALIDTATAAMGDLVSSIQPLPPGQVARSLYIDQTTAQKKKKNVAEAAEIPITKLSWGDKTASGGKKGIGLEWSYEFMQSVTLPVLQMAIAGIAQQNVIDDVADLITAIRDGDGDAREGSANVPDSIANYGVSGATGYSSLTYQAWLWWLLDMAPYVPSTIVTKKEGYVKLMTSDTNANAMPIYLFNQISLAKTGGDPRPDSALRVPNPLITVHDSVPVNLYLAVDKRYAVQAYTYAGMDISETQKVIARQVEQLYITTSIFYSTIFRAAVRQLNCKP